MLASSRQAGVATTSYRATPVVRFRSARRLNLRVCAVQTTEKQPETEVKAASPATSSSEAEEAALKYGLEAGLLKAFTSKPTDGAPSRTEQAKQLLTQYGSAYLITSISFAVVSFAVCYAAVSAGVDVADLLSRIGLQVTDTSEAVGTFTIAYAAHKALSPVRFPPTVALTPVVAKMLGKKKEEDNSKGQQN